MSAKMTKKDRKMLSIIAKMPTEQRTRVTKALYQLRDTEICQRQAIDAASSIIIADARAATKRRLDRRQDARRRTLVGARLPRAEADQYKRIAAEQGVSLYRWIHDALLAYAQACTFGEQQG